MNSSYKTQAESIDQKARAELSQDPDIAKRVDKTLPYLSLDMLLKSPYLSVNQMVVAAGAPFGVIEKFEKLMEEYLAKELVEVAPAEEVEEDETYYRIADRGKAESLFLEIAQNRS